MLLGLILACAIETNTSESDDERVGVGIQLKRLQHRLTWNETGVEREADGSLNFETDLGYRVNLQAGSLVSYSLRLYACPDASASLFSWLLPSAMAGHSDLDTPSNWSGSWVESIVHLETLERPAIPLDDARYCEGVYTVARADQGTENLSNSTDMLNWSFWVKGHYEKDGIGGDFEWITAIPSEGYWPLLISGEGEEGVVTVERRLAPLFDGIRFETDSSERSARLALLNLIQHATLNIELHALDIQ